MEPRIFSHGYRDDDRLNRIFADRARLPAPLAVLHAVQTGLPDPRDPVPATTPLRVLARDIGLLAGFMTFTGLTAALADVTSIGGLAAGIASLYGAMGVTGQLRRLVVGHTHEASHWVVSGFYKANGTPPRLARRWNELVLDIGSALTLTRNGRDYRRAHKRHHDEMHLGTIRDPDGMDLYAWGLWPGKGFGSFGLTVAGTALDPVWHLGMIASRLSSNLLTGTSSRRLKGAAALGALAASALVLPFPVWLMAIGLPWTVGYNVAALLQVLTEHPYGFSTGAETLAEHAERTWERVPIDPMPEPGLTGVKAIRAWAVWVARLAFLHVPSRLAVLDGSMIAHGFHHLAWPSGLAFNDWWETARRLLKARHEGTLPAEAASPVVWGLPEALRRQARRFTK